MLNTHIQALEYKDFVIATTSIIDNFSITTPGTNAFHPPINELVVS